MSKAKKAQTIAELEKRIEKLEFDKLRAERSLDIQLVLNVLLEAKTDMLEEKLSKLEGNEDE